jgi:hypothetical protein
MPRNASARCVKPTRLAVDRLPRDRLQAFVDPDHRMSFARAQRRAAKDYEQAYWWQPAAPVPGP